MPRDGMGWMGLWIWGRGRKKWRQQAQTNDYWVDDEWDGRMEGGGRARARRRRRRRRRIKKDI